MSNKVEQRARDARRDLREQRRMLDELAPPQSHAGAAPPTTIEVGAVAEARAVALLLAHGYDIVERNYRCEIGELDIVAADGDVMVFVEVRSRANIEHGHAIESVNRKKQQKVSRVAEVYLAHKQPTYEEFRFDVVAITGERARDITLYQDAWRGGLL
jgi:putative endonuclease